MKKIKLGDIKTEEDTKIEFYLTDVTLSYINKEPRIINYDDIYFLQEMFVEDKQKYLIGLYFKNLSSTKSPSLTIGDFSKTTEFLEAFNSVKHCIPNFQDNEATGFFGNILFPKQKPKRVELGMDHKHVLIRPVENNRSHFFKVDVNSCRLEEIPNQNLLKISLNQSQLEIINFTNKEDVFAFKEHIYKAIQERKRDRVIIYSDFIDLEDFKIKMLAKTPHLKALYNELVLSNTITEDKFWDNQIEFQEFRKYYVENKMSLTKRLNLSLRDKALTETDKQKILDEYPKLKEFYLKEVMDGEEFDFEEDKRFWEDFVKLQITKNTELAGGTNWIAIPTKRGRLNQSNQIKSEVYNPDVPSEVDLDRNLDDKTNLAESMMNETNKAKNTAESTIKKFQTYGIDILSGVKPESSATDVTKQDLIDEYKFAGPEYLQSGSERQNNLKKVVTSSNNTNNRRYQNRENTSNKMLIENHASQLDHSKSLSVSNSNVHTMTSRLHRLINNKSEFKEKKRDIFNITDMQSVFRELVQASTEKEEVIEFSQFRETYEDLHDQAKDLLRLFYSNTFKDDYTSETNKKTMNKLISELVEKVSKVLSDLNQEMRKMTIPNAQDKLNEANKLYKAIDCIKDMLQFAIKVK